MKDNLSFDFASQPDFVTINRVRNHPEFGDEREFLHVRRADSDETWSRSITPEDGARFEVRALVRMDARADLGLSTEALRARMLRLGKRPQAVIVQLHAVNAYPEITEDRLVLPDGQDEFTATVEHGSLTFTSFDGTGQPRVLRAGVFLGDYELIGLADSPGRIASGDYGAGYLTFNLRFDRRRVANWEVRMKASQTGHKGTWTTEPRLLRGEPFKIQVEFSDTGETVLDKVVMRVGLPDWLRLVDDTTTLKNASNPENDGLQVISNNVCASGIVIGSYTPNSNAFVRFAVKPAVTEVPHIAEITARVYTKFGSKTQNLQVAFRN